MTLRVPLCAYCQHYRFTTEGVVCIAFPDGVPDEILYDGRPHFDPYPGDHGVQFEPESELAAEIVARAYGRKVPLPAGVGR